MRYTRITLVESEEFAPNERVKFVEMWTHRKYDLDLSDIAAAIGGRVGQETPVIGVLMDRGHILGTCGGRVQSPGIGLVWNWTATTRGTK